jgi:hypothetical protein
MQRTLLALLMTPILALAADNAPRTYRFVCDYYSLNTKGDLISTKRISADYTRDLPGGKVRWDHVTMAGQKRDFMDGFTYSRADIKNMLNPEFFPNFPPAAFEERNLVWDTHMFENFGQDFLDKLSLNVPYHMGPSTAPLAGTGQFENKDVELTLVGTSKRNGQDCALIRYDSYFNKVSMKSAGIELIGRSHYWGDIWVSSATRQIEYATLYEDVLGELKMGAQPTPMIINVFRRATFQ